ncbi:hypothetical protein ACIVBQ_000418 [Tenacibaculum discolor]
MYIEVNNTKYKARFGYGAIRRICKEYGYDKPSAIDKVIKKLKLDKMGEDPSFEQLDFIGYLVISGVKNVDDSVDFSSDDVMDSIIQGKVDVMEIMKSFSDSLPKNNVNPKKGGN